MTIEERCSPAEVEVAPSGLRSLGSQIGQRSRKKGEVRMSDQCQKYDLRILSRREEFGVVARCPNGCIHICVGNTALRLSTKQYWTLMELLTESAQKIANPDVSKTRGSLETQVQSLLFSFCAI